MCTWRLWHLCNVTLHGNIIFEQTYVSEYVVTVKGKVDRGSAGSCSAVIGAQSEKGRGLGKANWENILN